MRIMYLTWGEVPRLSSVYGGQAVQVVAAFQRHPEVENASLVAGYPMIHSGMLREKWRYRKQLSAIRDRIGSDNFTTRRIPVPPVGVHPKPSQLPFFYAGQHGFLAREIRKRKPDVMQCRSYVATNLALEVRARYGFEYKVVFDARSLMPEEAVITGRWSGDGPDFQSWKVIEHAMLATSDLSTAVSKPMQEHFDKLGARRTALAYLNVSVDGIVDAQISDNSRLDAAKPVVAYCGYLAENSWHNPMNLWKVFASFHQHCPGAQLLVITKSNHNQLLDSLRTNGFENLIPAVTFTSAPSPAEVVKLLHGADLSVLSYRDPANHFEESMAEKVFATKTAEYMSVGLPMLVNRYCGGARDYALSHNAGVAYDPQQLLSKEDVDNLLYMARDRLRISRKARSDFSIDENAARLVSIFKNLEPISREIYISGR